MLMILALISGIAVSALQRTPLFISLENIAADLQLACASMRQTASYQNQSIGAVFNPETRIISCDGEEIEIPDGKVFRQLLCANILGHAFFNAVHA